MKLAQITNKQQLLAGIVITLLVLTIYGFVRFIPESTTIESLEKSAKKTQNKILKNGVSDEPTEDLDELLAQIQDQEKAMALIKESAENLEARLAAFDSQELKVRISQLANKTRVRIQSNQAVATFPQLNQVANAKKKKKKTNNVTQEVNLLLPASRGWLARLSPGTVLHRPLQRLELEGTYQQIQAFIHGLDGLPWQVTVIQMQLQKMPAAAPVGYPQSLKASLVLAL
jgi:Tfp pilus assembly protein PilO